MELKLAPNVSPIAPSRQSGTGEWPVTRNYRWPTPPYASFPADIEQTEAQDCEITAIGGRRVAGKLTFFLPEQDALEFQLPRATTTQTIYLGEILTLRLTRPIRLAPAADPAVAPGLAVEPTLQPFQLVLHNGEIIEGKTLGHVSEPFGTFLFPPVDEVDQFCVERLFVPCASLASLSIGGFLGQMLVDHNIVDSEHVELALAAQEAMRSQRIGDYLVEQDIVSEAQLLKALAKQQSMPVMRLGEALLELGMVKQAQLDEALAKQREDRSTPLGRILVGMGVLTDEDLHGVLARKLGFPVVDLDNFPVDANAMRMIPEGVVNRLKVIPLLARDGMLVVALEDPMRVDRLNELRFLTQFKIVPVVAPKRQIEAVLRKRFGPEVMWFEPIEPDGELQDSVTGRHDQPFNFTPSRGSEAKPDINALANALRDQQIDDLTDVPIQESDNTLVRLVNTMILDAYSQQVSDIHIESYPDKQKMRVRFRKDGGLVPYLELPASYRQAVLARIKIMADLDISERRKPQDGKIDFQRFGPAKIELRVATIPTNRGLEDVVMRILSSAKPVPLDKLNLSEWNRDHLRRIMEKSYGLLLVCGPTGSGKTTTLHSALSYINVPERKIWTAEDPVEITQPGLRQVQVNAKIGWTFAHALRSFLRADPDVIMVGEMRDQETARIGVEASLTGHLVLSTLHTNSAPESITRLLDMGVDPFNFADSLLGVLAQRLAKRLCPGCRHERSASAEEIDEMLDEYCFNMPAGAGFEIDAVRTQWLAEQGDGKGGLLLYAAAGCDQCSGTGYRGRIALHELLVATPEIKRLAMRRAEIEEISHTAIRCGMRTLKQDGISKILQGLTDLSQVRAVSN
jgi:type II secretory ATPase GspE/PulE/Tfp pilus assembly ATPase PilB-like protein